MYWRRHGHAPSQSPGTVKIICNVAALLFLPFEVTDRDLAGRARPSLVRYLSPQLTARTAARRAGGTPIPALGPIRRARAGGPRHGPAPQCVPPPRLFRPPSRPDLTLRNVPSSTTLAHRLRPGPWPRLGSQRLGPRGSGPRADGASARLPIHPSQSRASGCILRSTTPRRRLVCWPENVRTNKRIKPLRTIPLLELHVMKGREAA